MLKDKKKKHMEYAKKMILVLFINCGIIELFTGYITIRSLNIAQEIGIPPDFTPIVTLIGAVISEVIGYAVYSAKAAKENTAGGITYLRALNETKSNDDIIIFTDDTPVG